MRPTRAVQHHECAPKEWRAVPEWTGDYDFDTALLRCSNRDLRSKLHMYVTGDAGAYGYRTGYSGYRGYGGDD